MYPVFEDKKGNKKLEKRKKDHRDNKININFV